MPKCVIKGCRTGSGKESGVKALRQFSFPKDRILRNRWIRALTNGVSQGLKATFGPQASVCQLHFREVCK